MAVPELYHIQALRKLDGDAFVDFPTADLAVRSVERVYRVPRAKIADPDEFNSPETFEYADTQLTAQHFVGGDAIYVEVYQKWETLPGSALVTQSIGLPASLIPEKYRRLIRTVETNQPVGPEYVMPKGLTGDQTFIQLAQETIAKLRLKIIEEKINVDESGLVGGRTAEFGNLIINEEIVDEGTPPLSGELIDSSEVTPLGNGKSIRITAKYDTLAGKVKFTRRIGTENLIPQKYRRLIRTVTTEQPVPVDYAFPEGLTGDQTEILFQQETITKARLKITEEKINTDESGLIGSKTGEFGLLIIIEEIVDEGTPALSGGLIESSEVTPFGNGKAVRITIKYPDNLLDLIKTRKKIGIDSLIPAKYRRLIRTVTTEQPVPVDYTFPDGLTGNQTEIEFQQLTITQARLSITEEIINTDETGLIGGDTDQYGELIIIEEIVDEGTKPLTGFLYKKSEVTALGNGKAIRITVKYPDDIADIRLHDQDHDRQLNIVIPKTRRLAPEGTEIGLPNREIRALDRYRAEITEPDFAALEAVLEDFFTVTPGTANIQLPDVLLSIKFSVDSSQTDGFGEDAGSNSTTGGTFDMRSSGRSQSSAAAAIIPEIIPQIREIWAHNVPTSRCNFFIKRPFTVDDVLRRLSSGLNATVQAWPVFNPVEHTIIATGKHVSVEAAANASAEVGLTDSTRSSGAGSGHSRSKNVSISTKSSHIRPTIHGALSISYIFGADPGGKEAKAEAHATAQAFYFRRFYCGDPAGDNDKARRNSHRAS
jgi:hypothetical protein